ncbi:sensor histidine kinase [Burkholderia sp. WAC0059]|uniref:sensor histidine kinase n=1 Tax=Burkholderia sp. WAC0059 TaxID=2066022 RepID=UPI002155CE5C|nr:HAMP domain-containing sensor histidine kinase [Burkholderia sp. WAC0059]
MAATSSSGFERTARLCAEAALFMRDHVLSRVSHDLRSPLNAIHSWAYVLERKVDTADATAQRALGGIRTGVEQQVQLLEQMVDTTRSETRHLRIERKPFVLREVVEATLADVRVALADARGVTLAARHALRGETVVGDRERCAQALWLMLVFAVEASARGATVSLDVSLEGGFAQCAVAFDASAGALTDEAQPHLLEAFARTQAAGPQENGRSAWVLALCQRVAEAHGGRFGQHPPEDGAPGTLTLGVPLGPA